MKFLRVLSIAAFTFGATALFSCSGGEKEHDHDHEHGEAHGSAEENHEGHSESEHAHGEEGHVHTEGDEKKSEDGAIHIEPSDAKRFGISVTKVNPGVFHETIRVAGEVLPSAASGGTASSPVAGILTLAPGITEGTAVKQGQLIGRVKQSGVTGGDVNAAGRVALENAKRELARVTPLYKDGLVTRKEYEDAVSAVRAAQASYSPAAASGTIVAPTSGVISNLLAKQGAFVNVGDPVAQIAGGGRLTLKALLPASKAAYLGSISGATITPHGSTRAGIDLNQYGGRLMSNAAGGGQNGYIPVYFSFDASAPVTPGTASEVYLRGLKRSGVMTVPVEAVSEEMGEKFVYVKTNAHEFEKRPVTLGGNDGRMVEIASGLKPGEEVVSKGMSFVRLSEQSGKAPEGHSHNH